MLKSLKVKNLNLAESVEVSFDRGYNVVTGETGAGKSFLIKALEALFQTGHGGRPLLLTIADNSKNASISAVFEIDGQILDQTGELHLEKEFLSSGRSKLKLNGKALEKGESSVLFASLVDIDRQNAQTRLTDPGSHRALLDRMLSEDMALIDEYRAKYNMIGTAIQDLKNMIEEKSKSRELSDLYKFRLQELKNADLENSEPEVLQAEIKLEIDRSKVKESIGSALEYLSSEGGRDVIKDLEDLNAVGRSIQNNQLKELFERADIEPLIEKLTDLRNGLLSSPAVSSTPKDLDQLQAKLFRVNELERKYHLNRKQLIDLREKTEIDLGKLEDLEPAIQNAYSEVLGGLSELKVLGMRLSKLRRLTAVQLEEKMRLELDSLDLMTMSFMVKFDKIAGIEDMESLNEEQLLNSFPRISNGFEGVEFFLQHRGNSELLPIRKAASGGELSRILLALKTVIRDDGNMSTLILDEADVGVSGRTASLIGKKLRRLGESAQVIAITHLPQVACEATTHILVRRGPDDRAERLEAMILKSDGRVEELARLLSGKHITDESRVNARKLLESV